MLSRNQLEEYCVELGRDEIRHHKHRGPSKPSTQLHYFLLCMANNVIHLSARIVYLTVTLCEKSKCFLGEQYRLKSGLF